MCEKCVGDFNFIQQNKEAQSLCSFILLLISKGIYINKVDNNGLNALSYSCKNNNIIFMKLLLLNDIQIKNDEYTLKYYDFINEYMNGDEYNNIILLKASHIFCEIVLLSDDYFKLTLNT
mgnify:FL=1